MQINPQSTDMTPWLALPVSAMITINWTSDGVNLISIPNIQRGLKLKPKDKLLA